MSSPIVSSQMPSPPPSSPTAMTRNASSVPASLHAISSLPIVPRSNSSLTLSEAEQLSHRRGDIEEFEALQMALLASEAEVHKRSTSAMDVSDGKRHKGDVDALPFIDETPSFAEMFM